MKCKLRTRVPVGSCNSDSLGFSGVSASSSFRVIAIESCETRCSDDGSIPTASTVRTRWSTYLSEIALGVPEVPVHLQTEPELR
jgi:hypothetical protein